MGSKKNFYCCYLGARESSQELRVTDERTYELVQQLLLSCESVARQMAAGLVAPRPPSIRRPPVNVTLRLADTKLSVLDGTTAAAAASAIAYDDILFAARLAAYPAYGDIVVVCTLKQWSATVVAAAAAATAVTAAAASTHGHTAAAATASLQPVSFSMHAFRCDSSESALKLDQYLTHYRKVHLKRQEKNNERQHRQLQRDNLRNKHGRDQQQQQPSQNEHLHNSKLKNSLSFLSSSSPNATKTSKSGSEQQQQQQKQHQQQQVKQQPVSSRMWHIPTESLAANGFISSLASPQSVDEQRLSVMSTSPPPASSCYAVSSNNSRSARQQTPFDQVNREITQKLRSGAPLLFPPKDYTDDYRSMGDLVRADARHTSNPLILGGLDGLRQRQRHRVAAAAAAAAAASATATSTATTLNNHSLDMDDASSVEPDIDYDDNAVSLPSLDEEASRAIQYLDDVVDSVYPNDDTKSQTAAAVVGGGSGGGRNGARRAQLVAPTPLRPIDEETQQQFAHKQKDNNDDYDEHGGGGGGGGSCGASESMPVSVAAGVRNGVLTKLGNYHPQWLANRAVHVGAGDVTRVSSFRAVAQPTQQQSALASMGVGRESFANDSTSAATANNGPHHRGLRHSESARAAPASSYKENSNHGVFRAAVFNQLAPAQLAVPLDRHVPPVLVGGTNGVAMSEFILKPATAAAANVDRYQYSAPIDAEAPQVFMSVSSNNGNNRNNNNNKNNQFKSPNATDKVRQTPSAQLSQLVGLVNAPAGHQAYNDVYY